MKKAISIILICLSTLTFSRSIHDNQMGFGIDAIGFDTTTIMGQSGVSVLMGMNWDLHFKLPRLPLYAYFDFTYFASYERVGNFYLTNQHNIGEVFSGRIGGGVDFINAFGGRLMTFYMGIGVNAGYLMNIPIVTAPSLIDFYTDTSGYNLVTWDGFDVSVRIPLYLGFHLVQNVEVYIGANIKLGVAMMYNDNYYNDNYYNDNYYNDNYYDSYSSLELNFIFGFQASFGFRFWI